MVLEFCGLTFTAPLMASSLLSNGYKAYKTAIACNPRLHPYPLPVHSPTPLPPEPHGPSLWRSYTLPPFFTPCAFPSLNNPSITLPSKLVMYFCTLSLLADGRVHWAVQFSCYMGKFTICSHRYLHQHTHLSILSSQQLLPMNNQHKVSLCTCLGNSISSYSWIWIAGLSPTSNFLLSQMISSTNNQFLPS